MLNPECPKCYGALTYPTPWVGHHAHHVVCDCPPAVERARWLGNDVGLWGGARHEQRLLIAAGRVAWVDAGAVRWLRDLWEAGIWTSASCEGDSETQPVVVVLDVGRAEEAVALLPFEVDEVAYDDRARRMGRQDALRSARARAIIWGALRAPA